MNRAIDHIVAVLKFVWLEFEDIAFRMQYPGNPGALDRRNRREVIRTIKELRSLARKGVLVMAATNRIRSKGSPLLIVATFGGVTAGSPVTNASAVAAAGICGIAESAKDVSNNCVCHTEGVWNITMTVVTGLAQGDPLYMIPTTGVVTQTAAGNRLFGYAMNPVALGAGAATFPVKLAGSN